MSAFTVMVWGDDRIVVEHVDGDEAAAHAAVGRIQEEIGAAGEPDWQILDGHVRPTGSGVELPALPDEVVDYDVVREIAEVCDADLDSMEYMDPDEVRDLCRELLRLRSWCADAMGVRP